MGATEFIYPTQVKCSMAFPNVMVDNFSRNLWNLYICHKVMSEIKKRNCASNCSLIYYSLRSEVVY